MSGGQNDAAIASAGYRKGMAIFTIAKGGLMYEASIGGQKFSTRRSSAGLWTDQGSRGGPHLNDQFSYVILPGSTERMSGAGAVGGWLVNAGHGCVLCLPGAVYIST